MLDYVGCLDLFNWLKKNSPKRSFKFGEQPEVAGEYGDSSFWKVWWKSYHYGQTYDKSKVRLPVEITLSRQCHVDVNSRAYLIYIHYELCTSETIMHLNILILEIYKTFHISVPNFRFPTCLLSVPIWLMPSHPHRFYRSDIYRFVTSGGSMIISCCLYLVLGLES